MNTDKNEAKIAKLASKKKTGSIIKMMSKANPETIVCCLKALAQIGDEDSCNTIIRFVEEPDETVKLAACEAAMTLHNDYMKTHVRHAYATETNEALKANILTILNASR